MNNLRSRPLGLNPVVAFASVLGIALFLTLANTSLDGSSGSEADLPTPSYAGLRPLLQAGEGKQIDEGTFEVFCNHENTPSGWLWAVDDTRDGRGREYWVLHTTYLYPGPDNDGVELKFDHFTGLDPADIAEFVNWIVSTYPHVTNADELAVHECKVRLVE